MMTRRWPSGLGDIRRRVAHPAVSLLARLFLGGLFVWSGLEKIGHFETFAQAVQAYDILPDALATAYTHALPWAEVLAGGYLVLGLYTRWAAGLIAAMVLSFLVAITWVLLRGGEAIDCGCFLGGQQEPLSWRKWLEDVGLLILGGWLASRPSGPWSLDRLLGKASDTNPMN